MREAKTARAALDANNDAMAAVIAAMKSAGIKDRDLQTAGIQINPRYNYTNKPDGSQEAELVAYQVTNTLSVRVRDVDKTGEILDKAVSLGVNQGGGIAFTNDDPAATVTEARKKAVANAMAKAKTLETARIPAPTTSAVLNPDTCAPCGVPLAPAAPVAAYRREHRQAECHADLLG